MPERPLRVVQVNTTDDAGGAAAIARLLHRGFSRAEVESTFLVGRKGSALSGVVAIPAHRDDQRWLAFWSALRERVRSPTFGARAAAEALRAIGAPLSLVDRLRGHEDFRHPGSHRLLELPPAPPDVLHLHNLHGGYFDLEAVAPLSRALPTVVTLHDAWLLSGHCAHGIDCDRWTSGCGECPDLRLYPALLRDGTAFNWRRKQRIFAQSRLHVAAPCAWLMDRTRRSILAPAMAESRVIPHGVDLEVFAPGDKREARAALGLPADAHILLMAAHGLRSNPFKDYPTLRAALARLAPRRPLLAIAVGESGDSERAGSAELRFAGNVDRAAGMARYYRAADAYVHAARADTFPTAVLEAMACGAPVVASSVGGIPEQLGDESGILVAPGSPAALAAGIDRLLGDEPLALRFSRNAARRARDRFDQRQMLARYLQWYRELAAAAGPALA